jgi:hypothetical protein
VTDKVNVTLKGDERIASCIEAFGDYIKSEVLANEISMSEGLDEGEDFELVDGLDVKIQVAR